MERERRAYPRKRASTGVTFREPDGVLLRGWLVDIGAGGCFIASPSYLTFGEVVELELRLSDAVVSAKGKVVWTREKSERDRPAGMGVAFTEVNDAGRVAIDRLGASEVRLSRPSTVIGIAPAPRASSPSFNPPPLVDPPAPEPIAAPTPEPPPEPLAAAEPPKPPSRLRWIIAGGVAIVAAALGLVGLRLRHHPASQTPDAFHDAAPIEDAAPEAAPSEPPAVDSGAGVQDAQVADAQVADAATDAGRHKPVSKPKPKIKPKRH
jgi:uncharacterized protein (TIGR02266 family)